MAVVRRALVPALAVTLLFCSCAVMARAQSQQSGVWITAFDKPRGQAIARFSSNGGLQIEIGCDTAGPRPGQGFVAFSINNPLAYSAPSPAGSLLIRDGNRAVSIATTLTRTSNDQSPSKPSTKRIQAQTADRLSGQFLADNSAEHAELLQQTADIFRSAKKSVLIEIPVIGYSGVLEASPNRQALSVLREGCQNFLPPPDEELIWDWHQGRANDGHGKRTALAAQSVPDDPRKQLLIECKDHSLSISLRGIEPARSDAKALQVYSLAGDIELKTEPPSGADSLVISPESHGRLLAILRSVETIAVTASTERTHATTFAVAGFTLASRRMADDCPAVRP